jgi:hypothetical protein
MECSHAKRETKVIVGQMVGKRSFWSFLRCQARGGGSVIGDAKFDKGAISLGVGEAHCLEDVIYYYFLPRN